LADVAEIKVNKISVSFTRFNWYQLYSNVLWCFVSLILNFTGASRTYIGAMPGKMVQCLKNVGTANHLVFWLMRLTK
jgi:hypothetical protein